MKFNSFYACAVLAGFACSLAAQDHTHYEQGTNLGNNLMQGFSLRLKGNKLTENEQTTLLCQKIIGA